MKTFEQDGVLPKHRGTATKIKLNLWVVRWVNPDGSRGNYVMNSGGFTSNKRNRALFTSRDEAECCAYTNRRVFRLVITIRGRHA